MSCLQASLEEFASPSLEFAPAKELPLELEVLINPDDEQLLKIPLTLHYHPITGLLGGDGLHLNELPIDRAIRSGLVGAVATKSELDLGIDFSKFAPDLQVPAGVFKVAYGTLNKVLEYLRLLQDAVGKRVLPRFRGRFD